jgi:predicted ABC-type transport system involved in lysophospholipase L1 biosynthesis ATPase subunit
MGDHRAVAAPAGQHRRARRRPGEARPPAARGRHLLPGPRRSQLARTAPGVSTALHGLGHLHPLAAQRSLLPARLDGAVPSASERATRLLAEFGLAHLADRYPHQASLGEQQRVAVARALLLRPAVLLADEPTAHQDRGHADVLLDALTEQARAGSAVLLATHDEIAWARADRVLTMRDGRLSK